MDLIKELRTRTQAGIADCKKALEQTDGDLDAAVKFLREKGLIAAAKKAGRVASEGLVEAYIHPGGRVGVLVEVNCETDFVAKTEGFQQFVRDIAMHIAASPETEFVSRDEVPHDVIERERAVFAAEAKNEGKPERVLEKIVDGKLEKLFFKRSCLLEQDFIKNPDVTIEQLLKENVAKMGENITIRRFVRYERGEGIVKPKSDLAAEVAEQLGQ
ncbi:MAG TPA: translation elongation factor Ts [Limnochordia bacterium]|nr:translation elongation factor Ts [Limnochordia bacterium]